MLLDQYGHALNFETRALTMEQYGWLVFPTKASPAVTAENALVSPTVLACYRLLTETVAQLPIHIYRRGAEGDKERDLDHPAYAILRAWANPWTSAFDLKRVVTGDAILKGDGLAAVIRVNGEVRELHRLDANAVTIDFAASGEPTYKYRGPDNVERPYAYDEIVHVPGIPSGAGKSRSIIHHLRESIACDMAMAEHQARFFANGARPSGLLKFKKKLGKGDAELIREAWEGQHGGPDRAGKTAILQEDTEWQQISLNSVDSQFLELRLFAIREIARGFGIPSVLIGDLERATWRNLEELGRQFLTYALMPWLKGWENALTRAVLNPDERRTHFIEFLVDDLVRSDIAARFEAFLKAVGGPWMTPNEARALDNRTPLPGGDELRMPLNQALAGNTPAAVADVDPEDDDDDA